ncbi:uncharacterized protein LOC115881665 [Sitophilus oryzae]|uniref:Uncharacterized protein LOC115881665 n=1 Tax=Sitophilus oryzae TaxID=7048 RepID=A0A6J2XWG1_SITOR|nr:uncharacterized protein LOC115881665 [Sitophilus oryzae]
MSENSANKDKQFITSQGCFLGALQAPQREPDRALLKLMKFLKWSQTSLESRWESQNINDKAPESPPCKLQPLEHCTKGQKRFGRNSIKTADRNFTPLNLAGQRLPAGTRGAEELIEEWKGKALHGRYPSNLYNPDVHRNLSLRKQASDATGGGSAPVRQTEPTLAEVGEASGAPTRNRTTRSRDGNGQSTDNGGLENLGRTQNDPVPNPQPRTRRVRWTRNDNLDLIRAYYRATNGEQNKTGYRIRLYEQWISLRPDFPRESQQLADQLRSVLRRKVISNAELDHLKQAVLAETQDPEQEQNDNLNEISETTHNTPQSREHASSIRRQSRHSVIPHPEENIVTEEIGRIFEEYRMKYSGVDFLSRPRLPKIKYNNQTKSTVAIMNRALSQYLPQSLSLQDTCDLIYCAAAAVCHVTGLRIGEMAQSSNHKPQIPPWKRRLENKIKDIRVTIGVLHTYLTNDNPSNRTKRIVNDIIRQNNLEAGSVRILREFMDNLKQKIAALGCRLRRYNESEKRRKQNKQFITNQKLFLRALSTQKEEPDRALVKADEMYNFWNNIWGNEQEHQDAYWIKEEIHRTQDLPKMREIQITENDIKQAVSSLGNWKAPGIDKIQAYWWKHLTHVHAVLAIQLTQAIKNPAETIPAFFTMGITHMIPKNKFIDDSKNFRPITCLPVIYKIFTSVFEKSISKHLKNHHILAREQNGSRKGSRGSTEWLNN